MRAAVDVAAHRLNRAREAGEILERVELALLGKAEGRTCIEAGDRRAIDHANVDEAGAVRGLHLLCELVALVPLHTEEVAVETTEIAVDVLLFDDHLHAVNRRRVAFDDVARA